MWTDACTGLNWICALIDSKQQLLPSYIYLVLVIRVSGAIYPRLHTSSPAAVASKVHAAVVAADTGCLLLRLQLRRHGLTPTYWRVAGRFKHLVWDSWRQAMPWAVSSFQEIVWSRLSGRCHRHQAARGDCCPEGWTCTAKVFVLAKKVSQRQKAVRNLHDLAERTSQWILHSDIVPLCDNAACGLHPMCPVYQTMVVGIILVAG